MIKRKAHVFHTQLALQEHLDQMGDDERLAQYTVYDGMHYIITEKEVQQHKEETEIQTLEKLIKRTQDHFTEDLDNCIDNMNFYYTQDSMTDYGEYVKQYDGIMKRYGERLKDLHKRLDKLKNV